MKNRSHMRELEPDDVRYRHNAAPALALTPHPGSERMRHDPSNRWHDRGDLLRATAAARIALHEAASAAAVAAARALSMAEVLDEALAVLDGASATPVIAAPARNATSETDTLSPREREVLALVAEGRTNKAIAEALYVSPNTVKTHVASLLNKLQAGTRVDLAAMAARQGVR